MTAQPSVPPLARVTPINSEAAPSMKQTQQLVARVDARDRALMIRVDATNAGMVHALTNEGLSIGRHRDNSLSLDDQGISRFHVQIVREYSEYWIEDLGSSNGTYVNGQPLTAKSRLSNGATIQLGPRVCFRFSVASAVEEQALKQLYESSVRDAMTRLYNRQYFGAQLTSEFAFALRHKSQLSVLLLDVDYFKRVNDTHGHIAGDQALKTVGHVLEQQLRTEDILARYGGEEFIVLLRGISLEAAALAGERLRAAVEATIIECDAVRFCVTISVGCASISCCTEPTPEAITHQADVRLYKAKNAGRNRVIAAG